MQSSFTGVNLNRTFDLSPKYSSLVLQHNRCYSITVDVNFNALKSFCVAFTPKLFNLRFPELNINAALILYTDSIKYLRFTFTNSHKDDNDMMRQMRMLYARSNRLVRLFHFCSRNVLIELGRSFCGSFYCYSYLWTSGVARITGARGQT